jgi:hypothetical protein
VGKTAMRKQFLKKLSSDYSEIFQHESDVLKWYECYIRDKFDKPVSDLGLQLYVVLYRRDDKRHIIYTKPNSVNYGYECFLSVEIKKNDKTVIVKSNDEYDFYYMSTSWTITLVSGFIFFPIIYIWDELDNKSLIEEIDNMILMIETYGYDVDD